jgi:hypothetical protein
LRIIALAALAAALLAVPALAADDGWDSDDRISPAVKDDATQDEQAAPGDEAPADKPARPEKAPKLSKADRAKQKALADQQKQQEELQRQQAADQAAAEREQQRQTASADGQQGYSNVLGPLWGVPTSAPVMKDLDPELEKQYARDHQGRLVPKSERPRAEPEAAADDNGDAPPSHGGISLSTDPGDDDTVSSPTLDRPVKTKSSVKNDQPAPSAQELGDDTASQAAPADPYAGLQPSEVKSEAAPKAHKSRHKLFKDPFKKKKKRTGMQQTWNLPPSQKRRQRRTSRRKN